MSLMGNPVKDGDGPAAVTPPFSSRIIEKGPLSAFVCHCSLEGMGRPLEGRGSQKTCLGIRAGTFEERGPPLDLEDKKGNPRIDESRSGDFFLRTWMETFEFRKGEEYEKRDCFIFNHLFKRLRY